MNKYIDRMKPLAAAAALMGAMGANAEGPPVGDWHYVGGEQGWTLEPAFHGGKTREKVLKELANFQNNSASGDWRYVGGEPAWVLDPVIRDGKTRSEVLKELDAFKRDPAAQAQAAALYGP